MSGVRTTVDAIRSRAARMSSIVSGSMGRNAHSTQLDFDADLLPLCFPIEEMRRRQILDRKAERLEERNLIVAATARRLADQYLANLADDVIGRDLAVLERNDDVARLLERGLAPI